jgi:hypothetical protein
VPLCPHCDVRLDEVRARKVSAVGTTSFPFGKRYNYACPPVREPGDIAPEGFLGRVEPGPQQQREIGTSFTADRKDGLSTHADQVITRNKAPMR